MIVVAGFVLPPSPTQHSMVIIRPFCIEKISLAAKCEIFRLFYGSIKILATRKRVCICVRRVMEIQPEALSEEMCHRDR